MFQEYLPLFVFCLVASITPGPNTLMLMASGLNYGVVRTLPHLFGIITGFPVLLSALALGMGTVFIYFPQLHQIIKYAGAGYLLFLAWKIANSGARASESTLAKPLTFFQAALFQWLNPKAWIIAIGALATFTSVEKFTSQFLWVLLSFFVIGSVCMLVWLSFGAMLNRWIKNPVLVKRFNILMACLLALSVLPMLL